MKYLSNANAVFKRDVTYIAVVQAAGQTTTYTTGAIREDHYGIFHTYYVSPESLSCCRSNPTPGQCRLVYIFTTDPKTPKKLYRDRCEINGWPCPLPQEINKLSLATIHFTLRDNLGVK